MVGQIPAGATAERPDVDDTVDHDRFHRHGVRVIGVVDGDQVAQRVGGQRLVQLVEVHFHAHVVRIVRFVPPGDGPNAGRARIGTVIDHFGINCSDWPAAQGFYDRVLGELGYTRQMDHGVAIGYGRDAHPSFWIADASAGGGGPNRRCTSRFRRPTSTPCTPSTTPRLALGAESLHEPRLWPDTTPATTVPSSATPTATTSRRSSTALRAPRSVECHGRHQRRRRGAELLRDLFTRIVEHVDELTDGLSEATSSYRPVPTANSIAWLVWHSARVQDAQVADIAGIEQVWTGEGWVDRFGLDLPRDDTGYGHSAEQVGKVRADADLLAGDHRAVHAMTLDYVTTVTDAELARVVDHLVDPARNGQRPTGQHRRRLCPAPGPGRLPAGYRTLS